LLAEQIVDAGANLGDNESSFNNDHVWPSGNRKRHLANACRRGENESVLYGPNDNALVAFWHPARVPNERGLPPSATIPRNISRRLVIEKATVYESHVEDARWILMKSSENHWKRHEYKC